MVCPGCGSENTMVFSILSNGLICLEQDCGFEIEMPMSDAHEVMELTPAEPELVCA